MVQSRLSNNCYPEPASIIKALGEPHQMAASANHELGGCVIQLWLYLIDIVQKNYRGVQGYRPFQTATTVT